MTTARIPLVGTFNPRGLDGNASLTLSQDQRFLNCTFDLVHNPFTNKNTIYVCKRPGWGTDSIVSNGNTCTALIRPQSFNSHLTAFGETNSTIFFGDTSVGNITGRALHFTETIVSSVSYVMMKSSDGTGWYYADGAKDDLTYVGNTHTNTTIDSLDNTTGMYSGQLISGTGIVAGTRIASVNSASSITVDTATTATNAGITITKEPIAKILSANFSTAGTQISAFVEMDGYLFYVITTGSLYNSNLNSVHLYTAIDFLSVNMSPDPPLAVARQKDKIVVLGSASKEVFFDAGNASASPLQRMPQYFEHIGTLDQRSVTTIDNDIFFVSSPSEGDIGVYQIKDLQSKRISSPQVERILGNISTTGGAIYASAFRLGGYPYLSLFFSLASDANDQNLLKESGDFLLLETGDNILLEDTSAQSAAFSRLLVYNVYLELWTEWDCSQSTFIAGVSSGTASQLLAASRVLTDGKVYSIYPLSQGQLYTDDGTAFSMQVRTSKIDFGTSKRKRIKSIRLICDSDSTGSATLEWSDDDYATWSTARPFDLTSKEPKLTSCGSHKGGRAYRLTHSSNSNFRAEALEIEYESEAEKVRMVSSSTNAAA
jgi:hypothetical protein